MQYKRILCIQRTYRVHMPYMFWVHKYAVSRVGFLGTYYISLPATVAPLDVQVRTPVYTYAVGPESMKQNKLLARTCSSDMSLRINIHSYGIRPRVPQHSDLISPREAGRNEQFQFGRLYIYMSCGMHTYMRAGGRREEA